MNRRFRQKMKPQTVKEKRHEALQGRGTQTSIACCPRFAQA
jgi:hypothetical protein